jgi:small subunit ribosomal protein S20
VPKIKSAKKRLRQTRARTARNRSARSRVRTAVKKLRQATTPEARAAAYREAERLLDQAGRKRLIHPNAAARLKSRLTKKR